MDSNSPCLPNSSSKSDQANAPLKSCNQNVHLHPNLDVPQARILQHPSSLLQTNLHSLGKIDGAPQQPSYSFITMHHQHAWNCNKEKQDSFIGHATNSCPNSRQSTIPRRAPQCELRKEVAKEEWKKAKTKKFWMPPTNLKPFQGTIVNKPIITQPSLGNNEGSPKVSNRFDVLDAKGNLDTIEDLEKNSKADVGSQIKEDAQVACVDGAENGSPREDDRNIEMLVDDPGDSSPTREPLPPNLLKDPNE